jgi:hypothetical protein
MITLLPNERLICQSTDGNVNLTTYRILYEYKEWGQYHKESIMLEDIIACENKSRTYAWLPFLGTVFILIAFLLPVKLAGIIAGLICFGIYWNANKNVLVISSSDTTTKINVDGMKSGKIIDFMDKIEKAKNERLLNIKA